VRHLLREVYAVSLLLFKIPILLQTDLYRYIGTADNVRDLNNIVTQLNSKFVAMYFYSYYTMIGTSYASMYPNGFDRMIFDGTVNAELQYSIGDNGISSLQDAEKGLQIFFDSCAASTKCSWPANPLYTCTGCYFWAPTAAGVKVCPYRSQLH
jgi:pimeloyl-ACP methyl ester carboxylesterase